ncbi:MAG: alpha/beta fold hydrolase [Actinomycetota bacterium]
MNKRGVIALFGTAAGVGTGLVAQHSMIKRRRRDDPEGGEAFGTRRGVRSRSLPTADGSSIFIEEAGPESALGAVFLHGSCLRTDTWHYQLPGIGDHRLVFYDLRGHGLSQPKGSSPYSIETLARDLEIVVHDSELEELVLVGHSVGGMVALEFCRSNSELLGRRIKGVVLLNSTHRPAVETLIGGAAVSKIERATRRPFDALGDKAHYIDRLRRIIKPSDTVFMAVSVAAFGPNASAKQIDFTYDMLAETPIDVIFDLIKSYREFDVTHDLGQINVPAMVIGGTHDRLTIPKASEHLAENLPNAELKMLAGCGHMSMLERHRELNRTLERFLDEVFATRKALQS